MTIQVPESEWRHFTRGGIPYRYVSAEGWFTEEAAEATEVLIIRARSLGAFALESFPSPYAYQNALYHPMKRRMPGTPLSTKRISWKSNVDGKPVDPFGVDVNADPDPYEGDLQLTIQYGTSPANDQQPESPESFLEVSANAAGSFLMNPIQGVSLWKGETINNTTEPDEEVSERNIYDTVNQSKVDWSLNWSQIPHQFFSTVLKDRLREAMGKVNETTMPLFYDAPPETILFLGWSLQHQYTWRSNMSGEPPIKLSMKFVEVNFKDESGVDVTHNHQYRPNVGFRRILFGANKDRPKFSQYDLNSIFTP